MSAPDWRQRARAADDLLADIAAVCWGEMPAEPREGGSEAHRAVWDAVCALRVEVERLRGEVSYLRACVPPTHPTDYGHEVWTETVRAQVAAERAAVVAWLRNVGSRMNRGSEYEFVLLSIADAIENGEHRREEDKP